MILEDTPYLLVDYRGPNGHWTNLANGIVEGGVLDFDQAYPTYAHYALTLLLKRGTTILPLSLLLYLLCRFGEVHCEH